MMNKKCEIGETHFISPPRPCAPNLWKEGYEDYERLMKKVEEKRKKSYPSFWFGNDLNLN